MDDVTQAVERLRSDPTIEAILDHVCRDTAMGFAAVARVTDTRWVACQVLDKIEFGLQPGDELELKTTICNDIRGSGTAIFIDHVAADTDWRTHPIPALYGFQSYASVPIVLGDGRFFGTLCAIDPEPHDVSSPEVVAMMRGYAEQIAKLLV